MRHHRNAERRPQLDQLETTSEILRGGGETTLSVRRETTARRQAHRRLHAVVDGAVADALDAGPAVDLSRLSAREWSIYLAGHESGASWGIDRGRQQADDEAQWPLDLAQRHVHALAEIEPHEVRWRKATSSRRSSVEDELLPDKDLIANESAWQSAVGQ